MILLAGENLRVVFSRTATADVDWPVHIKLEHAWRGAPVLSSSWRGRVGAGGPTCSCRRKKEKNKGGKSTPAARTSLTPPTGGTSRGGPPYCGKTILPARRLCCSSKVSAPSPPFCQHHEESSVIGVLTPSRPTNIWSLRDPANYQAGPYGFLPRSTAVPYDLCVARCTLDQFFVEIVRLLLIA
jgi:hypothetical protein